MPGIFGVIKKRGSAINIQKEFYRMNELLSHMPFYTLKSDITEKIALGSIQINSNFEIEKIVHSNREYIIFVDGHIYSLNGLKVSEIGGSKAILKEILYLFLSGKNDTIFQIEGNYTIGIWDALANKITLISDIIGAKKLYYANLPEMFVFAPEVKAISFLSNFKKELNWKGISDFFNYGYILGDDTFFQKISCLSSGSTLCFDQINEKIIVKKYWSPTYRSELRDIDTITEECISKLENSMDEKITSGETILCPISGGLDSRIIISMLKNNKKDINILPITHGQGFSYEYKNAVKVCDSLKINSPSLVELNAKSVLKKYKKSVWLSEGMIPFLNAHLLLYYPNDRITNCSFFNGIYGGPTNYDSTYYASHHINSKININEKIEDIRKSLAIDSSYYKDCLNKTVFQSIIENQSLSISKELKKKIGVSDLFCDQRDSFFIENRMRRNICQMSVTNFFWEEKLPLSNYSLYDHYLSIPPDMKMNRELIKRILIKKFPLQAKIKDANTGLNLYQEGDWLYYLKNKIEFNFRYYITRLSLGKIIVYDKRTYNHYPIWLSKDRNTRAFYEKYLFSESLCENNFYKFDQMKNAINFFYKSGLGFHNIIRMVSFSIWYELFVLEKGFEEVS